jgi:hypothetical protein
VDQLRGPERQAMDAVRRKTAELSKALAGLESVHAQIIALGRQPHVVCVLSSAVRNQVAIWQTWNDGRSS